MKFGKQEVVFQDRVGDDPAEVNIFGTEVTYIWTLFRPLVFPWPLIFICRARKVGSSVIMSSCMDP